MNYNTGGYNQSINYLGIFSGNYNDGAYNSVLGFNTQNPSYLLPKTVDIFVDQGNAFYVEQTIRDSSGKVFDLSLCTFTGNISKYAQTAESPINVISADAKGGKVLINIPADASQYLTSPRYVYDVVAHRGSTDFRILTGQALINNR